ncbi:MAG: hypothetical protein ACYTAN_15485 [Planctomycetota bacterium]
MGEDRPTTRDGPDAWAAETEALLRIVGPDQDNHDIATIKAAASALTILAREPLTPDDRQVRREAGIAIFSGLLLVMNGGVQMLSTVLMVRAVLTTPPNPFAIAPSFDIPLLIWLVLPFAQAGPGLALILGGWGFRRRMEDGRRAVAAALAVASWLCVGGSTVFVAHIIAVEGLPKDLIPVAAVAVVGCIVVVTFLRTRLRFFRSDAAGRWCARRAVPGPRRVRPEAAVAELAHTPDVDVDGCGRDAGREYGPLIFERSRQNWLRLERSVNDAVSLVRSVCALVVAGALAMAVSADTFGRLSAGVRTPVAWSYAFFWGYVCISIALLSLVLALGAIGFRRRKRWGRRLINAVIFLLSAEYVVIVSVMTVRLFEGLAVMPQESFLSVLAEVPWLVLFGGVLYLLFTSFNSPEARLWARERSRGLPEETSPARRYGQSDN